MKPAKFYIFFILVLTLIIQTWITTSKVFAQSDIVGVYDIVDKSAKDGDILIFDPNKGIARTATSYDPHLFGILETSPMALYQRTDGTGTPIARSGITQVNVTTLNGAIKAGDYITSSPILGYGMKATQPGFVIGIALGVFNDQSGQALQYQGKTIRTGSVNTTIGLAFASITSNSNQSGLQGLGNAVQNLSAGFGEAFISYIQTAEGFNRILKFIFAVLIMLVSLSFAFVTLIRAIPKAIEAVGRNPLARKSINTSLAINVALVVAVLSVAGFITILILNI